MGVPLGRVVFSRVVIFSTEGSSEKMSVKNNLNGYKVS